MPLGGVEIVETKLPSADDFRLANNLGLIISRSEAAAYQRAFPDAGPKYIKHLRARRLHSERRWGGGFRLVAKRSNCSGRGLAAGGTEEPPATAIREGPGRRLLQRLAF